MLSTNLKSLFNEVEEVHRSEPAKYYLKEGKKAGIVACHKVLKYLKKCNVYNYITREEALPNHPAFPLIQDHILKIQTYYPEDEIKLNCLLLRKLLPQNPLPFRSSVLTQLTFRTAVIYINDLSNSNQVPIPARIDGYYDFIAPIADNDLRIPLLVDDPYTTAQIPPSIHFSDDNKLNGRNSRTIMITEAPKVARSTQFHAFISLLSRSNPKSDLMQLFHDSLNSADLTFAICTCVLAANEPNVIMALIRILLNDHLFDHFLRSLCAAVRKSVVGGNSSSSNALSASITRPVASNRSTSSPGKEVEQQEQQQKQYTARLEMAALQNAFVIASEDCWYSAREVTSLTNLILVACNILKEGKDVPSLALYVLRAALTIAAYEDACGDAAIGMFIDLVIQPFIVGSQLEDQLTNLKRTLIVSPQSKQKERNAIEQAIISVLEQEIIVTYPYVSDKSNQSENKDEENDSDAKKAELNDLQTIYKFVSKNVDPFVRMAIILNSRTYMQSPPVQAILLAFQRSNDIRALELNY